jgi:hypothetical protein
VPTVKHMSAELIAIRDSLKCGHCEAIFKGSDSQAFKVKYEKTVVYCSVICRSAGRTKKLRKPIPQCGPCPTCKQPFFSRNKEKIYCSMACYASSDQMKAMLAENRARGTKLLAEEQQDNEGSYLGQQTKLRLAAIRQAQGKTAGKDVNCLECGTVFWQKPASKNRPVKKFCTHVCYRLYKAKRFDRWIANPEQLQLPQNYDEFLSREELPCIIEGCDWHGNFLSLHVNQAHGITAAEFKRAAGFNLTSGIVSEPLARKLQERDISGVALDVMQGLWQKGLVAIAKLKEEGLLYRSKESHENKTKGRVLHSTQPGPIRTCLGCSVVFQQSTPYGRALYCTPQCRDAYYAEQKRVKNPKRRERNEDGTFKQVYIE